ncbi:MAG: cytochrome c [Candidatus Thiodiazotropha taylori]|nr:cytochrome c [Candidatus Thiodiazotropha taylori]
MKLLASLSLTIALLLPATASTDDSVEDNYHYRSRIMENASNHLKALQGYVKGELSIESHIPTHVDALLNLNQIYQDLFPAGDQHPESEALPLIWNDPRGFQSAIQHNRRKIMTLKEVDPSDMKTMKRAVNDVRMSCGDCHYYFRER